MADPWLKFYTSDWRSDPRLRMCGIAARGLWIEMICIMHEATPYGHLLVSGQRPTDAQLAVQVGTTPDQITALLGELESAGVFSRTRQGVIYSRRLTRMAKKAATARNNGRKGGNPTLRNKTENLRPIKDLDNTGDNTQKPEARYQNISSSSPSAREEQGLAESVAPQSVDDDITNLYDRVVAAAGLQVGTIPTYWMPPTAIYHVARWRDLGLFDDEIVEIVRNQRRNHAEPPSGPKAFDRAMQICSSTKSLPKLEPIQQIGYSHGRPAGTPHPNHERLRRIAEAAARGTT
ncbi:hypothetical protein [Defluviimonas sp. WL0075]|uniref:Uncharacterized protein n=1 Tax=Albidovulum sediminicola TaxID=2984331 RepID=A0ABT2Z1N0_9RHOB|nr:hypothetical protein [Defluviimonas sp. WL0075]MCV2865011.1 hypothetical protein [Defluviimonas sp. WL0075]